MTPRSLPTLAGSILLAIASGLAQTTPIPARPPADAERGRLVVFVQPDASPLAQQFQAQTLPELEAVARELGVTLDVIDASAGAPEDVTLTPLLVFQNHRGRSIYAGRSTDVDRVRTFLRTSRRVPQGPGGVAHRDLPVLRSGRAVLALPIKVGDVTGSPPPGHDAARFAEEARAGIAAGLADVTWHDAIELGRSDRAFHLDFYPYRGDDGTLYLSTALFSPFHCKQPIARTPADAPHTGPWSERERLFAQAAAELAAAVAEQRVSSERGDGFDPLPGSTPVVDWAALGLALPAAPAGARSGEVSLPLPLRWTLPRRAHDDTARLVFHFPPPLDGYGGEATQLEGFLDLAARPVRGAVEVETASVTLGEPDLDRWVHGDAVLDVAAHPMASFTLEELDLGAANVAWGSLTPAHGEGSFRMRGLAVAVDVRAQIEPVLGPDGDPRLLVTGTFVIPLGPVWGVDVPVGSPPTNETLVFDFDFPLEPQPAMPADPGSGG